MNLKDPTVEQIKDLIEWMRQIAALETPAALVWAEIQEGLRERALFLESYTLKKIPTPARHLHLGPQAPMVAELVGIAGLSEVSEPDPNEGAGNVFLSQYGKERETARNGETR